MEEKLEHIKNWLGTGSINIFGLPMSGKDTVGIRLAENLDARFLSSGMIIRAMEQEKNEHYTDNGALAPTDVFYEWVLPYFGREDLKQSGLILSSVGRWSGEENQVMSVAAGAGHEIKAAIILNISIHFYSTQFQFNFYKPVKEWETGQSDHTLTPQVSRPGLGRFCQKSSLGVTITSQACRL